MFHGRRKLKPINGRKKDPVDSIMGMLSKDVLLDIIRNFMFFRVGMGNATKVIARYMQYRAARKIVNRVSANLKREEEESPKLLIVTDMLLTGFDAPILQTMYLDKPLKEHRLLQAIARTNRPYKGIKEAGVKET